MSNLNYPTACVIIIGNEILSGQTVDSNLSFISKRLITLGIQVKEARVIPDHEQTIIDVVNTCRKNHTYVFTTGGIGPTHDDITSQSVAKAFERPYVCNEEATKLIFSVVPSRGPNDSRIRMAYMPEGAVLINNPVSHAPGFQIENVFVLAGVPNIAHAMMETLDSRINNGKPIYTKVIHCIAYESVIADCLRDIQNAHPNVEIGSYPTWHITKDRGVKVVLKSRDLSDLEKTEKCIFQMALDHNFHAEEINL
jgi:molybdenum cofactor synthesis domain-containing protein